MKTVVTAEQMKALDAYTIEKMGVPSLVLMERAALAVVEELTSGRYDTKRILVACGSGNNGGDGVAIARILHLQGFTVDIWEVGNPEKYSVEMKTQMIIAGNYQVNVVTNPVCAEYTVIVDAIFGIGLTREVAGKYKDAIEAMNASKVPIVAVDIPSGIHSDTGKMMGCAICAATTITFGYVKAGILLGDGQTCSGCVKTADIGIYDYLSTKLYQTDNIDLQNIPRRPLNGNKGTFGKVLLVAGSKTMVGAALLAGKACMRAGCGMLKIFTHRENKDFLLANLPEAMLSVYDDADISFEQLKKDMKWADVYGIGPGLSTEPQAGQLLEYLLLHKGKKPCVIDADALNLLSQHLDLLEKAETPCILTPHMGEFARLLGESVVSVKEDMVHKVRTFAQMYEVTCVCKDARSITVMPDGTGYINTSGCSGMATAGSGDVLTGLLLGILAQTKGHDDIQIIPTVVYLHGMLGQRASKRLSEAAMLASDLIEELILLERELANL